MSKPGNATGRGASLLNYSDDVMRTTKLEYTDNAPVQSAK